MAMVAGYSDFTLAGDLSNNNAWESSQPDLVISQFGTWSWGPSWTAQGAPWTAPASYAQDLVADRAAGRTGLNLPNTLFIQGNNDSVVNPCSQSAAAYWYLTSNGHPASYLPYNGGHEFSGMDGGSWSWTVGNLQLASISFAYDRAHALGVLPWWERGPGYSYSGSVPSFCS